MIVSVIPKTTYIIRTLHYSTKKYKIHIMNLNIGALHIYGWWQWSKPKYLADIKIQCYYNISSITISYFFNIKLHFFNTILNLSKDVLQSIKSIYFLALLMKILELEIKIARKIY